MEESGLADLFPYYAGFAFDWAYGQLQNSGLPQTALILDPWNGSGTTTLAAQTAGFRSIGLDLNPIANIVAQLRCLTLADAISYAKPSSSSVRVAVDANDPLNDWFATRAVGRLRDWTSLLSTIDPLSRSLGYVSIFRTVRQLTASFAGTNPTWVKRAKELDQLVDPSPEVLDALITEERSAIVARLKERSEIATPAAILTASAKSLPIVDESVDLILTSPPYLTRIDYAVAYSRELAVIGLNVSLDRSLRSALMGTTLIRQHARAFERLGREACSLLDKIHAHGSKASKGYYYKQACQYLADLSDGLDEVTRVARPGAGMVLVVQDSYYKDVHVPLADICIDEAELRGWELEYKDPYPVKRLLTSLNTSARAYKKGEVSESVIRLRKKSPQAGA